MGIWSRGGGRVEDRGGREGWDRLAWILRWLHGSGARNRCSLKVCYVFRVHDNSSGLFIS